MVWGAASGFHCSSSRLFLASLAPCVLCFSFSAALGNELLYPHTPLLLQSSDNLFSPALNPPSGTAALPLCLHCLRAQICDLQQPQFTCSILLSHFHVPERNFASTIAVGCSGTALVGKQSQVTFVGYYRNHGSSQRRNSCSLGWTQQDLARYHCWVSVLVGLFQICLVLAVKRNYFFNERRSLNLGHY